MIFDLRLLHAPQDDIAPPPPAPQVDEYGIPDNPYAPPQPSPQQPVRRSRVARYARQQESAQEEPFQPPVSPEIPDWLRTAQQNNLPLQNRPQGPRVQSAPRQTERPGAVPQTPTAWQSRPQPQPQLQPQEGWQVETDQETIRRELPAWIKKVPWLGIAAFAAVLSAVLLWVMGMQYNRQTEAVLEERAGQEAQLVESHPLRYQEIIAQKADKYNLSPAFVAAIMLNESSFRPDATNGSTGARGLMQLVSDTAEWVHGKLKLETPFRFDDMYEPERNAEYGCWYLNYLSGLFHGDPVLVAAAFHAGQGEVRNWLNTAAYSPDGQTVAIDKIPFGDTRRYVGRVINDYAAYLRIYYGQ